MDITDPVYDVYGGMVQIKTEQYNDLIKAYNDAVARIAELEAERAELVKDRERLDWLETADNGGYHCDILWHAIDSGTLEPDQEQELPTLRQAIDAAREGE